MSYGQTFAAWRAAAGDDWDAYVRHPFVAGLADGTLPRESFLHYLRQDYVFLVHFARAWALGVTKSETYEEHTLCAQVVYALLHDEMPLHIQTCADEGIGRRALFDTVEAPANLAYTRYVLDAGHSGDLLDLFAALAPCVLGYGEIGARLSGTGGPYAKWIETYAGDEYQSLCRTVGAQIYASVAQRIGTEPEKSPRWSRLCGRFRTATQLEIAFWQMGLDG